MIRGLRVNAASPAFPIATSLGEMGQMERSFNALHDRGFDKAGTALTHKKRLRSVRPA